MRLPKEGHHHGFSFQFQQAAKQHHCWIDLKYTFTLAWTNRKIGVGWEPAWIEKREQFLLRWKRSPCNLCFHSELEITEICSFCRWTKCSWQILVCWLLRYAWTSGCASATVSRGKDCSSTCSFSSRTSADSQSLTVWSHSGHSLAVSVVPCFWLTYCVFDGWTFDYFYRIILF